MKRITRIITLAMLLAVICTGFANAQTGKLPVLKSYDLAWVQLENPVTVKNESGKSETYDKAYLIRMRGDFPIHGASIMRLYFGDEPVAEYGGAPDGLYFLVYEQKQIKAMAGKEIFYKIDDGPKIGFKVRFDPRRFQALKLMKFNEAVTR